MSSSKLFLRVGVDHPLAVLRTTGVITLVLVMLAALPSIWPQSFAYLSPLEVDTDPENMLPASEEVRVFHNQMKQELSIQDMIVVGVVNHKHQQGVFNPATLTNVYELTKFAKTLHWPEPENPENNVGVVEVDILSLSTLDNIEQDGLGSVRFDWLMPQPPESDSEALSIRDKMLRIPLLNDTVVSEDGKALALYLPLTSKALTWRVYNELQDKIDALKGDEEYYITGLPVAEDNFGVEMFIQMGISAPFAMGVIFLLMLLFFRKLILVVSPMLVAMASVMCTMGLLIVTGNTIHIMSSMIPIFIMPIAVLDSVHILSQFFDRYQETEDRRATIEAVLQDLHLPMLFTSLTTAAGFASLALAPIPPVQVFGLYVAFGVMLAWLLTITLIPAYIMRIPEAKLAGLGMPNGESGNEFMTRLMRWTGNKTYAWARPMLAITFVVSAIAIYGVSQIVINDNPIRWFDENHKIRVADKVLNQHFAGTYMSYLTFSSGEDSVNISKSVTGLKDRWEQRRNTLNTEQSGNRQVFDMFSAEIESTAKSAKDSSTLFNWLEQLVEAQITNAKPTAVEGWDEVRRFLDEERQRGQIFKSPQVLHYIEGLQQHLQTGAMVGKVNSLTDIVKTVHRELLLGDQEQYRIPDTPSGVAQTLLAYQNSHRPHDLWHFVTPDFKRLNLWIQMRSGDNIDMSAVVKSAEDYIRLNPPPVSLEHNWFGLNYINVVWQDRMVNGMFQAFLGSFMVVFLMMLILLRSGLWALLSMVPLTLTIGSIYGLIGFIGKDYDMPVAVLSALSLGLAIDFSIHFLVQDRKRLNELGNWKSAAGPVFGAPARAITRNGLVISIGFLPLLLAPLVPYQTVGLLIAAILATAGAATLVILPALIRVLEPWLLPRTTRCQLACNFISCALTSIALYGLLAMNLYQFAGIPWNILGGGGAVVLLIATIICGSLQFRGIQTHKNNEELN